MKTFKNKNMKEKLPAGGTKRRNIIKGIFAGIPFLTFFSGSPFRIPAEKKPGSTEGETSKEEPSGQQNILPSGKIAGYNVSRLILGCNLISGYAHARDLRYADTLFKVYHSEEKVIETYRLAEAAGINAIFVVNRNFHLFNKYREKYGSKMLTINQTYLRDDNFLGDIDLAVSNGATMLYIQGAESDRYVRDGKTEMLGRAIEYIKKHGKPAGIGAHSIEVIKACEKEGIPADFYVKSFHHDRYWSAHPVENRTEFSIIGSQRSTDHNMIHDNIFDLFPNKTAEFMKEVRKPWIAFKVLAAGAILPQDGFRYAFENGADFICVGMFDFQIAEDAKIAAEILNSLKNRTRNWYS